MDDRARTREKWEKITLDFDEFLPERSTSGAIIALIFFLFFSTDYLNGEREQNEKKMSTDFQSNNKFMSETLK